MGSTTGRSHPTHQPVAEAETAKCRRSREAGIEPLRAGQQRQHRAPIDVEKTPYFSALPRNAQRIYLLGRLLERLKMTVSTVQTNDLAEMGDLVSDFKHFNT